ncbi:MAG TPA: lytic transglycosylase domain-containing protein [Blastocatellia bacterium]|nr:lytic transglycosylase domain-containing protein [Blastocatellia bacterium]
MSVSERLNRTIVPRWAVVSIVVVILLGAGVYAFYHHWTHRFDTLIIAHSAQQNLDPMLVKSLIYEESFFNQNAKSDADARGLMQVTPIVIKEWASRRGYGDERIGVLKEFGSRLQSPGESLDDLLFDPEVNLTLGCWYLHFLLSRYNGQSLQLPLALAAYNAGPSKAENWLHRDGVDVTDADQYLSRIDYPATREYVRSIMKRYDSYKRANRGL